jgi:hypothetical protein
MFTEDSQSNGDVLQNANAPCKRDCQGFTMRAGAACVPVGYLTTQKSFDLLDIEKTAVATCKIQLVSEAEHFHSAAATQLPSLDTLLATTGDTLRRLAAAHFRAGTNIHSALPAFDFLHVEQHCGRIPMWAYPLLNLTPQPPEDCTAYMENALANAMYLLRVEKVDSKSDKTELAELLSEMQTLPLRAQLYVIDFTRSPGYKQVDKWENPLVTPNAARMSFDCEDAALRMLQESQWLLSCSKSKALQPLVEAERAYVTFMVGMSLKLRADSDKEWCYHAAVLKLDRAFVMWRLFPDKFPEPVSRWPAVLLEGTNYTTGCWEYKSRCANADVVAERSAVFEPVETISKATPALIRKKALYGAIQSLFSPELAMRFGIVQIELGQNGKRAAFASSVMQYDRQVQWLPLQMETKKFQEQIQQLHTEAYPIVHTPKFTTTTTTVAKPRPSPDIDCLVRAVDFSSDVAEDLARKWGKRSLTSRVLKISDDLQIVHLWST